MRKRKTIPRSGRSPGGGNGNLLQYSCLENPMDRWAWQGTVCKVTQSQTRLKWLGSSSSSQGYGFSSSHVGMWELDYKKSWVPKNWCFWTVVLEKTLESPLDYKEIQPVYPKGDQSSIFTERTDAETWNSNTLATWRKELTHCKKTLMLGKIAGRRRRDDRGWDGWMASPTQWTRVWASSGSWWWSGKPGVLQSMGSQRVRHDWVTELNWRAFCYKQ